MIQQAEGLKHNPHLMLIDDADRPAKWYFALKQNLYRVAAQRGADGAPDGWAGYATLEQLVCSTRGAWAWRQLHFTTEFAEVPQRTQRRKEPRLSSGSETGISAAGSDRNRRQRSRLAVE
jgi:hypothetical protein